VRVGANAGIREGEWRAINRFNSHHGGETLKVHLVHDSGARRNDTESIEGPLRPAEELVAFRIALIFAFNVLFERLWRCPSVNLYGVVNDEIGGDLWVDSLRINAKLARRIAQRSKVNDRWDASEILEHHAGGKEGEFALISRCDC
jgi:hypothetical protein